jgi:hypothetical protein
MKNFLKSAYCLMIMGVTGVCQAQTVSGLSGDVLLCNNYSFSVSSFNMGDPDAVVVGCKFTKSFGGSQYYNTIFYTQYFIT